MAPRTRPWLSALLSALISATSLLSAQALAQASGPSIKLFPTTVLEEIRTTGEVAAEMESGLQSVIAQLDQQQQLYTEARCDGAEGDPGCERIAKNMGASYLEMLTIMDERLPEMERAVNATHASLEKRLRSELGRKLSPWTLQETLLGNSPDGTEPTQPALRGRSGLRLSERFRQYYQLVSTSGPSTDQSLAVVASDIYLDMDEASMLIAQTRQEITRATLLEQLNQSFGVITPQMQEVVGGVKSILFGEDYNDTVLAGPPPGNEARPWRSPLEM